MYYNITVIIPTMNRPQSLKQTISSIVNSSSLPSQIIIIDQSTYQEFRDSNIEIVQKFKDHLDIQYEFQDIPSLTKARNRGLELAQEEIIVFSDDDVDVLDNTFASVYNIMQDPEIALVGGFNQGEIHTNNSFFGYLFCRSSYRKRNLGHVSSGVYGRFPISQDNEVDTEWAMGFFFVVRKSLVEKWQCRFDEKLKFYAYAEDLDFTYGYYLKSQIEHYRCIMSRSLTVKHNASAEYRITQFKVTMMEMIHREYIAYKYKDQFSPFALFWSNIGTFLYRLVKNNNPLDVLRAMRFISRNKSKIIAGELFYNVYMN